MTLGSDWPIAPYDPRPILAAAQLRRPWDRPDLLPVMPSHALAAQQALDGYTIAPAIAVSDDRLGRVEAGYRADLTIWAEDPTTCPADQLSHVPIDMTAVDATVRHRTADVA